MNKTPHQTKIWMSPFGKKFTDRRNVPTGEFDKNTEKHFGYSASTLYKDMIGNLKIKSILEVGCNAGLQLAILSRLGDYSLYGIDPQQYALEKGRKIYSSFNFVEGSVLDLPFKNSFFDLVFTYEVLIHIAPGNLTKAMREMVRVSKKYILGMEYNSSSLEQVSYRGKDDLLWKRDFESYYLRNFPELRTVKSRTLEWKKSIYQKEGLTSKIFLLSK